MCTCARVPCHETTGSIKLRNEGQHLPPHEEDPQFCVVLLAEEK